MKATINKIEAISNSQFNLDVSIIDDKGDPLTTQTIGFNAPFSSIDEAVKYVKDAIRARADQYIKETTSVTKPEIEKLIGQEFDL